MQKSLSCINKVRMLPCGNRASASLAHSATALEDSMPTEIIAGEMQLTLEAIGDIVGVTTSEDVLDQIFGEFCIGK